MYFFGFRGIILGRTVRIGKISETDIEEFEKLGTKYAILQLKVSAILSNYISELTVHDETQIYEITMAQNELHTRRMALIRYQAD